MVLCYAFMYLAEINSSQPEVWRKAVEVLTDADSFPRGLLRGVAVRLRLSDLRPHRTRQSAGWPGWCREISNSTGSAPLACRRAGRGTRWDQVLQVLVAYSLVSPGSEWRLRREWFDASAMAYRLQRERSERGGGCRFSTGNYAIFLAVEQSVNYGDCSCFPVASPYSCPCTSRRPHPADHRTASRRTRPPRGFARRGALPHADRAATPRRAAGCLLAIGGRSAHNKRARKIFLPV